MTESALLLKQDIAARFRLGSWQQIVFSEFATSLESASRPFPCIFGVQGYRADQLRYVFQETLDIDELASALAEFVRRSRQFGPNTSLVVFTKPETMETIEVYQERFWAVLKNLAERDEHSWPDHIPTATTSPQWEFCFAGEPIFVVCNTPAHLLRQSRRASSFMLTFQPRWVFEKILGTEKAAKNAFASVRERLVNYDFLPVSPALGKYGDPGIFEHQQYFLDEANGVSACPYHTLKGEQTEPAREMEIAR
ncbi:YqcI/YcgG family protein [Neorhizobium sp. NPDC001467]|uniref:YqcI/YcgG family protein n=1 Tax=Neorhizobium sp. NPDC001467 TaxID=3390595 RepID=UPI003D06810B